MRATSRLLVLFVGKRAKAWYFQKDVAGQTRRILIGRYPLIAAGTARTAALGFALERGSGADKLVKGIRRMTAEPCRAVAVLVLYLA